MVSHAAPSHHFKSLSGLLTELSIVAFDEFTIELKAAYASVADQKPTICLQAVGNAYVEFTTKEPQLLQLMFSVKQIDHSVERLCLVSAGAYQQLVDVVKPLLHELKGLPEFECANTEMLIWSVVHGYANLCLQKMSNPNFDISTNTLPPLTLLGDLLGGA